jgi:hypothetical protein
MRPLRFVGALALALILAVPAIAVPVCDGGIQHAIKPRPAYDPGGDLDDYIAYVTKPRRHPLRMEIHECYSACAMKLSAKDVCISRDAVIGIHEARRVKLCDPNGYDRGVRDPAGTAVYRSHMPACAQRLFDSRNAFASNRITKFTGQEVLDACPQIKVCAK